MRKEVVYKVSSSVYVTTIQEVDSRDTVIFEKLKKMELVPYLASLGVRDITSRVKNYNALFDMLESKEVL